MNPYGTRINPGYMSNPGAYGMVMPNSGMSVAELVAAAMGQANYRAEQQQGAADAISAMPGQLMSLLRGGVAPNLAGAAVSSQANAIRPPSMTGNDPMLDMLAANRFNQETDQKTADAIMEYLRSKEPSFFDQVKPIALALGGMAVGGLGLPGGMMAGGGLSGAALGGTVGQTLAQLLASRY